MRKIGLALAFLFILFSLPASSLAQNKIDITEMKMATAINENLMPVKVVDSFPKGTPQVFCWFQWRNAEIKTKLIARWYFITDNIHILNTTFTIPRKEGAGSISLSMPENKALPSGAYRVDLILEKRTLKSLNFKIE